MNLKIKNYKYINMNVGIVYRIFYDDLSYIGSTINLTKRMWNHRCKRKNCSSKKIMCYDYAVEVLAEIYYVENKNDINLLNLEREYMEQYNCVNKRRPIITEEERKKEMKEYNKEYKKTDKRKEYNKEYNKEYEKIDKRKEYKKEYQKEYKKIDKYKEYQKEYKKTDKYKEYRKEYYLKNKK